MDFDDNPEAQLAGLKLRHGGENMFITGEAGTGKTTLLNDWRDWADRHGCAPVVLAPTGLAALLIGGQTIHSFFRFPAEVLTPDWIRHDYDPSGHVRAFIRKLKTLVLDEVSMVRADMLDAMEYACRRYGPIPNTPWGGVRLVCFGDFMQLPPVVTPSERHFFDGESKGLKGSGWNSPLPFATDAWAAANFRRVTLRKNYRLEGGQRQYRQVLDGIRFDTIGDEELALLNTRAGAALPEDALRLYSRNAEADAYNRKCMKALASRGCFFDAVETFYDANGQVVDTPMKRFENPERLPVPRELLLKVGARIMLRTNLQESGLRNGEIGVVTDLPEQGPTRVTCLFRQNSLRVDVSSVSWREVRFLWDKEAQRWRRRVVRDYSQIPLLPAWAMTIHKSQGQTVHGPCAVEPDCFAAGQLYVALSRVTRLDDLFLLQHAARGDIKVDRACLNEMRKANSWDTEVELPIMLDLANELELERLQAQRAEQMRRKASELAPPSTAHRHNPRRSTAPIVGEAVASPMTNPIQKPPPAPASIASQSAGCLGVVIAGLFIVGGGAYAAWGG